MEVHPFNQEGFGGATLEEESGAILGVGQVIHWKDCDRAYQRKQTGGFGSACRRMGAGSRSRQAILFTLKGEHTDWSKGGVPDRPL
ncbi:hypothetical protein V2G26_001571 [Clonostachys chloroleuca]